ncbi:MAG: DNA polymerase Y family protein [Terracidiphilus sp.]
MSQELYACVHVAEFPAQALLRLRQDWKAQPVVVLEGQAPQEMVCSMNALAERRGATLGMTRLETESLAGLRILPRSGATEAAARDVLLECAATFSPRIEEASEGTACTMVLDIDGTTRLFGPPVQMAERLRAALLQAGFRASIAVSANFDTARMKAATVRGIVIVPDRAEAEALAGLPIAELDLEEEPLATFALWGIRTLGELATLPATELVTRMGEEACGWQQLARGNAEHTFQPIEPDFALEEFCEFETPVEQVDSLLFVGARMIDCLVLRAAGHALALASLSVEMRLDGGGTHRRTIRPALPTIDRKFLLKLLQMEIAAHPPPAGVLALTLKADAGQSSKVQLGLFTPQMPEPSQLDVTLARLKAIVGEDRVGSPVLEDSHRPGSFHMEKFEVNGRQAVHATTQPRMALRRVRPPALVWMTLHDGKPATFRDGQSRYAVEAAYGPWKTAGCWWTTDAWDSEEWDVLAARNDSAPIACLLVRDCRRNEWRLEALYD